MSGARLHGVLLATAVALGGVDAPAAELVVVVNDQMRVEALTADQVREIFLGERPFWGGVRVRPVTYPDQTEIMQAFLRRVLEMSGDQYRGWWIKRIFRQGDTPPERVNSRAEALGRIAATPGAIGFLWGDELDGGPGVRPVLRLGP